MKLFICQYMNGKTDDEILAEREIIKHELSTKYEIIDSYIEQEPPNNVNPGIWYLAKSIELLSEADCIYCTKDYIKGRGCRIERMIAEDYDLDIIDQKTSPLMNDISYLYNLEGGKNN